MITRLFIDTRESFAGGFEFPITGPYEKIVGRVYGEVAPSNRLNKIIVNLKTAPQNKSGNVEYWSDFCILKPVDMARGNRKIFFDAPNRGSKRILSFLNDAPAANNPSTIEHAGNGFLMRRGYAVVWCGWQGDLTASKNSLVLGVPAKENGDEIARKVRSEIVVTETGIHSQPLSGDERVKSYPAESLDKVGASLTIREKSYGKRILVPTEEWEFARAEPMAQNRRDVVPVPSAVDLYLHSGFIPGRIYELIYTAKNPLVLGLGFAAVRDFVSFLRYELRDRAGNGNPLASDKNQSDIRYAYAWGRSQSGRFLRDFVYHGFNEDEAHRRVFEAVAPHVAGGGRCFLNYEFARPVTSSQQHTNQLEPELFPHTYNVIKDAQTGRFDGILKRPKTDPYIFHTQTSTEYWQKRGCLAHTDGKGRDLALPQNVRIYVIASAQHNSPFGSEPELDDTQQLINPLPAGDVLRALMVALDWWVTHGLTPPPSRYPTVKRGWLVAPDQRSTGFPKIPGVRYNALHNRQLFLDYGANILRGQIDNHPPKPVGTGAYTILVPKVDGDGNDLAGIRLPAVQIPIGTYTGWNLQSATLAEDELNGLLGSFIPFAKTKTERQNTGDPRLSLEERYKDAADYIARFSRAARELVEQRYLLAQDAERMIAEVKKTEICRSSRRRR